MPLRFTFRQLEYLVAVAEAGSIAAAAAKVNVSSPSISSAIAQLEADLGVSLFVRRHAQGLALTQPGREIVGQAREILAEAARLGELATGISGRVRGPLAVGCLLTFAQVVLPQLRRGFQDRFPEVEFRQSELDQAEIFEGLRSARLDIALTYDLQVPPDLAFEPLVHLPPHVVVSEDHPLAGRASVTAADLAPHPMVMLDLPFSSDYFLSFFTALGVAPRVAERTRDLAVMRSLVANGFGYSIANIRPVSDLAPDGRRLRFVPLTGPVRPMQLGLASMAGVTASRRVRAFADHARREISERSVPGLRFDGAGPDRG